MKLSSHLHKQHAVADVPDGPARVPPKGRSTSRRSGRTRLSVEGWYFLLIVAFVLAAAMLQEMNLMLALVGMLLGPILLSWRLVVVTLGKLALRRRVPSGVCAGDLLLVSLELSNTRRRIGSWATLVEERISCQEGPGANHTIRPNVFFFYVPAGESRTGSYRGRLAHRGRYRLGPARISTRFPFGFISRRVSIKSTDSLTVFPRLGRLMHGWIARHQESFEGTQHRESRHSRVTGEFYGVREWNNGDSRRWIHWRSSAKHGSLVVRQFEQNLNRDVALLLDLWQPEKPKPDDLDNVELAVSFAATVVAQMCRKGGSSLLLGTTGQRPDCIAGPASIALMQSAMERLAVAEASDEDRLPKLFEQVLGRIAQGTEVVVISTRAIDLCDSRRFEMLQTDPARRALLRRILTIDTSTDELAGYFQPE